MFARMTRDEIRNSLAAAGIQQNRRKKITVKQATKVGAVKGSTRDERGIVWCGRCDCRVAGGRCTNVRCSTNLPNKVPAKTKKKGRK